MEPEGSIPCSQKKLVSYGEGLLGPRPFLKLEDHLLLAVRDWLFNIFTVTLHTWGGRLLNPQTKVALYRSDKDPQNSLCFFCYPPFSQQERKLCHLQFQSLWIIQLSHHENIYMPQSNYVKRLHATVTVLLSGTWCLRHHSRWQVHEKSTLLGPSLLPEPYEIVM
jgi:hypothetical protein